MKILSANHTHRTLAATVLGLGLLASLPAMAEDARSLNNAELKSLNSTSVAGMSYPAKSDMRDHSEMDGDVEARIQHLHDQLKVTPDQEDAWSQVAKVMRANSSKMKTAYDTREASTNLSAPDDIKAQQKLVAVHASALSDFSDAFSTFYDKLTPDQQQHADRLFSHMAQHEAHKGHAKK